MSHSTDELETRVAAALRSEADGVLPEDGSLDVIRRRGHAARQRRRLVAAGASAAAVLAVAVAVPLLRDDRGDSVSTEGSTTTTAPPDTTGPSVAETPTPDPEGSLDQALWPDPSGGELFTDPVDAARSFVTAVTGVDDPPLSGFIGPDQAGGGTVDLYRVAEDGTRTDRVASMISLRQLDGEHWFVTMATSTDVRIDSPATGEEVSSPLAVAGEGHGFEGTLNVRMLARTRLPELTGGPPLLGETTAAGGSGEELQPFTADLPFDATGAPIGILIVSDTSGVDVSVPAFSAVPVRLAGPSGGTTPSTPSPTAPSDADYEFPQVPLWPFSTQAEADQWLATADQGHQPWHAEAEATAQFFTMNYLGFTEIDQITSRDVRADEAWIGVGFRGESVPVTAAVIHLRRFGPSQDAPWEVVGTRDTDLTLDLPDYGSTVSSPITVGGAVSGVEGNLTIAVRQMSTPEPLGVSQPIAVTPRTTQWDGTVSYTGATDPALTVVVTLQSDVRDPARFAITAVQPG